ncbi:MAG: hypothetical protein KDH15_19900 [Rhodocyclaceae bacterium]|nr:hypothetical protein [Rhodocyclaceae bacterium]
MDREVERDEVDREPVAVHLAQQLLVTEQAFESHECGRRRDAVAARVRQQLARLGTDLGDTTVDTVATDVERIQILDLWVGAPRHPVVGFQYVEGLDVDRAD